MRPEHRDLDLLSQVLQGQDAAAEGQQPLEHMVPVDSDSLMYIARQRARLAMARLTPLSDSTPETVTAATWIDGFTAGAETLRRLQLRGDR